ncbi:hypothetical protein RHMOL_Rhmol07G0146100 [Rhododendron molle]|uniref:Uncharacterized protein n=1 Tax=Rhododendron molle TaxID=49168 RepID=A0ACC0N2I7_RHOML|nr:hypothetical protein RHMOL_Rhmol07G0146100 [Rhododendron molle]
MASLLLPSPSSSSTSPPSSLSSSLFSRSSLNHRCLRANAPRSRICLRNVVKCSLSEPLNGKPCVPILNDGSLSKFLASKRLESAVHRSNNRLKIFSGTANPSLSQTQGRESIAAKLVANLITEAGADRVLACDLHSGQSMGYFDIPVDHVYCQVMNLIGDVKGKVAVMVDDMIDTAGTIAKGAALLHDEGAREVYACSTHAVFSPPAVERLSSGLFQEVIITNTIPVMEKNYFPQLTVLSVANLLGETIWRVHDDCSVSSIFQ